MKSSKDQSTFSDTKVFPKSLLPSVLVSADEAVATDPQFLKFWKIKLFATMSMASSSSPIPRFVNSP